LLRKEGWRIGEEFGIVGLRDTSRCWRRDPSTEKQGIFIIPKFLTYVFRSPLEITRVYSRIVSYKILNNDYYDLSTSLGLKRRAFYRVNIGGRSKAGVKKPSK